VREKINTIAQTGALLVVILVLALAGTVWSQDDDYMSAYTGADADQVGSAKCIMCHSGVVPGEDEATHIAVLDGDEESDVFGFGCEACHGPGGNHNGAEEGILSFEDMPVYDVTAQCTQCHEELGGFKLTDWADGRHLEAGTSCTQCHSGHSAHESFLIEDGIEATCLSCHDGIDTAEHGVPGSGMACTTCHKPHN